MSTEFNASDVVNQDDERNNQVTPGETFEGKLVSLTGGILILTSTEGLESSHRLVKDARITRDGTACQPNELKAGRRVRVTTAREDKNVAIHIESLHKHQVFTHSS